MTRSIVVSKDSQKRWIKPSQTTAYTEAGWVESGQKEITQAAEGKATVKTLNPTGTTQQGD